MKEIIAYIEEYLPLIATLGWSLSLYLVAINVDWAKYYRDTSFALFALFGVFLTIALLKGIQQKIQKIRTAYKNSLLHEISILNNKEMRTNSFERKSEFCEKKIELYEELTSLQKKHMIKVIMKGMSLLLLFILLQPVSVLIITTWTPVLSALLQGVFWISVYQFSLCLVQIWKLF